VVLVIQVQVQVMVLAVVAQVLQAMVVMVQEPRAELADLAVAEAEAHQQALLVAQAAQEYFIFSIRMELL
jgi:hypothetical protein